MEEGRRGTPHPSDGNDRKHRGCRHTGLSRGHREAGRVETTLLDIEAIGWRDDGGFVDLQDREIDSLQALSLGMDVPRSLRPTPPGPDALDRAGVEDLSNKGCLRCCGRCFRATPICCRHFSMRSEPRASAPPSSASRSFARGRQHRVVSDGITLVEQQGPYGAEGFFARRCRRCRTSKPISGDRKLADRPTPAGCRSARTKIRSPAIHRGSCRTQSVEPSAPLEATTFNVLRHDARVAPARSAVGANTRARAAPDRA